MYVPAVWSIMMLRTTWSCVLWLWIVWVMHHATQQFVEEVTPERVASLEASRAHISLLEDLRLISGQWAFSHAVRTITGVIIATDTLYLATEDKATRYWPTVIATFCMVWVTASAPGYLSDKL